jgi:malate dehydrogenase (oxaloacetate-decarboxylating)(NADP+)
MSADVALNMELLSHYPFCRLTGPANVLVMPGLHAANIASKLLQELGGGTLLGPLMMGLDKSAQIVQMGATVTDLVNIGALAAHETIA